MQGTARKFACILCLESADLTDLILLDHPAEYCQHRTGVSRRTADSESEYVVETFWDLRLAKKANH